MALLQKHRRSMGNCDYAAPRSGWILRREAKDAPAWALSADGVTGKTYDDHGMRRVRVGFSEFIIQNGRVAGEIVRKPGEVLCREAYMHPKHGVGFAIDLTLDTKNRWLVLLEMKEHTVWILISVCKGIGGVQGLKPNCTAEVPGTPKREPDGEKPAPKYEDFVLTVGETFTRDGYRGDSHLDMVAYLRGEKLPKDCCVDEET